MVRWSDRWKKVHKPLINGYVFAKVTEQGRREVLEDPGIIRTVFWNGRPARIRNEEMEAMQLLIREGSNIKMKPLHPGNRVKVTEGGHVLGITGLKGVVLKVRSPFALKAYRPRFHDGAAPHAHPFLTALPGVSSGRLSRISE